MGRLGRRPPATNDASSATGGVSCKSGPPEDTVPATTCGRGGTATCELEDEGGGEMMWPSSRIVADDHKMETPVRGSCLESSRGPGDEAKGRGRTSSS